MGVLGFCHTNLTLYSLLLDIEHVQQFTNVPVCVTNPNVVTFRQFS